MSIWKDNTAAKPAPTPMPPAPKPLGPEPAPKPEPSPGLVAASPAPRAEVARQRQESLIAADITIEGKIEGGGSVRIAGKFKGDVSVEGDLAIETGAKLSGRVRADKVTIAGELEGNVEEASRVELLATALVNGDVKAGSLTVAAGARMRGQADFGWDEGKGTKIARAGVGAASGAGS